MKSFFRNQVICFILRHIPEAFQFQVFKMKSYRDLEKIFSRKMLEIPQVFLRFFMKKSFQSLVIFHFKHLKLRRFGYIGFEQRRK